jgi:hypothetical protein
MENQRIEWGTYAGAYYCGSGGMLLSSGVSVEQRSGNNTVRLASINSQGRPGTSKIDIPVENIPEFVAALLDAHTDFLHVKTSQIELLPRDREDKRT